MEKSAENSQADEARQSAVEQETAEIRRAVEERHVEVRHEVLRTKSLPRPAYIIFIILTFVGLFASIYHMFGFAWGGFVMLDAAYFYLLMSLFVPCAFLGKAARRKDLGRLPKYDIVLAIITFIIPFIFFPLADEITNVGLIPAPLQLLIPATIFIILSVESGRRVAGTVYVAVCVVFGLYPLIADKMPGIFYAFSYDLPKTLSLVAFGNEGIIGVPSRVLGLVLMGFLVFAGFMIASGAGKFFLDLAMCVAGRFRGGPAKVAVISSAGFGSLSGSTFSNVVATGSITIPIMKRTGFRPEYAGAIETVASTGGQVTPPVMGGVVFIMVVLLELEYVEIMLAALIPCLLYYFNLMIGVDAYAAREGLKGVPREELPSLKAVLKKGWPFLVVLGFLVFGLVYMRWGMRAPFYASGLMFLLSFTNKETAMTPRKFIAAIESVGQLVAFAYAIFMPMGFIINGLVVTGVTASLTASAVALGGGNVIVILVIGFLVTYLLGMAGVIVPAYIFLAVTMAPAAIKIAGLDPLAIHLFIVYYCVIGPYTLPVAGAAFIAASIADSPPLKTALTSMRLGIATYFIPFFFAFSPALVLRGDLSSLVWVLPLALLGILFLASGMEGYLMGVGRLRMWASVPLVIAGVLVAFPEMNSSIIGTALAAVVIVISLLARKREARVSRAT